MNSVALRFAAWKNSILGKSKRELKGSELSAAQLESFVQKVLPPSEHFVVGVVVGANTAATQKPYVEMARDQLSKQYAHIAQLLLDNDPPNKALAQGYTDLSGWIRRRSAVNFLWLGCAERSVLEAIQLMVLAFQDPQFDHEFENIEISIDRSFIKEPGPVNFWLEYLRSCNSTRAKKGHGLLIPKDWRLRNHPYHRKYRIEAGVTDFSDLVRNHMRFVDSRRSLGIQIADICAQICRRFHCGAVDLSAYALLRPRIAGFNGTELLLLHFDETTLHKGSLEKHSRLVSLEKQILEIKTISQRTPHGSDQ